MGRRSREKRERREKRELKSKRERAEGGLVKICKGIILAGTLLLLFTPLVISGKFFFPFVGPKSLYFMGLVEIIFTAWLILVIFERRYWPKFNLIFLALILFLIISILATIFGVDPSRSFWSKFERMTGLLMLFHLFAFFLVISSVFQTKADWRKIFSLSIFVAILVSLLALFPKLGGEILARSSRGGATIGNSSFMGVYLLFNIFLALWLFVNSGIELKIYSGFGLLFMVPALFLSGARAASLSFLGGLILLFFLYLTFVPKRKLFRIFGGVLLIASFLTFSTIFYLLFQPNNIIHQEFIKMGTRARLVVWEEAWKGFKERPFLGWGPENFDHVFTKYFHPCLFLKECGGEIWFDRAHNIIFDTLISSGILGLLSYFGIFLSAFYILWREYFKGRSPFWTSSIFSVSLIAYFVQNLTVFDMINSYLMFFLVLGFVARKMPEEDDKQTVTFQKIDLGKQFLIFIILILFLFSFSKFIIGPLQTDYYVIKAISSPNLSKFISFSKKALEASPLGKYQIRNFFAQRLEAIFQSQKANKIPKEELKKGFDFIVTELKKSIEESPLDFRSHLELGKTYNSFARFDPTQLSEAQIILEKAIKLSPTNQQGFWALAQTKLYQGKMEEALSLAEKALALEPRVKNSHLILIQIAKIAKKNDLAKQKAKEALDINPSWQPEIEKILNKG